MMGPMCQVSLSPSDSDADDSKRGAILLKQFSESAIMFYNKNGFEEITLNFTFICSYIAQGCKYVLGILQFTTMIIILND